MATGRAKVEPNVIIADDGEILHKDPAVQRLVEQAEECQNEIDRLHAKLSWERVKIDQECSSLGKEFFEKRDEIIAKIPNLWFLALASGDNVSITIKDEEEKCLNFLTKLDVEDFEGGYRLKFYFDENPYFEDDVIVKELNFEKRTSVSTPIKWKDGMDLATKRQEEREVHENLCARHRGPWDSVRTFFEWFVIQGCPGYEEPETDWIGQNIRDVWKNPLRYMSHARLSRYMREIKQEEGNEREEPMPSDT